MVHTSLLGVNAAQKLSSGFTVLKVWLFEMSSASLNASAMNLDFSPRRSVKQINSDSEGRPQVLLTAVGEENQIDSIIRRSRRNQRLNLEGKLRIPRRRLNNLLPLSEFLRYVVFPIGLCTQT